MSETLSPGAMRNFSGSVSALFLAGLMHLAALAADAQTSRLVQPRVSEPVNESRRSTLAGNTHRMARPEFDRGAAPGDLPMQRMLLVLKRSAEQETALESLLAAQLNRSSPSYHKWLTPDEFGRQFGVADEDVAKVTTWLQSHGFQVSHVSKGKSIVEFSGTASQVQEAFHTEIHKYSVNGNSHWANANDPQIPAALAPVITGVATLHNFTKKPQIIQGAERLERAYTSEARPEVTGTNGAHALLPADFATIYDSQSSPGVEITIAIVGRSNVDLADVRSFGTYLAFYFSTPSVVVNGPDPGDLGGGEEAEAVLDVSWAWATANSAAVKLVVSQTTNTTDGVDLSEEYIIDNNLADVMSESFGSCEAAATQADISLHLTLAQQAAAQGITYVVASGDSGAEGCDGGSETNATGPLSVNFLSSTPYTISVGGTQFNENGNDAQYWSSTNYTAFESVISYIPENVWNESCTSGGTNPCPSGYSPGLWASGGGASTIFSKPSWQAGVAGIPNDGWRDVPDVSFSAAEHDPYLICLHGSCTPNSAGQVSFYEVWGTSAATPSFAGIMALLVQRTRDRQGQAASVLYQLAAAENLGGCNSSNTSSSTPSNCIFHDVTVGNNAVPGESGYGTSTGLYQAGMGYDLATGLGSVDAWILVGSWPGTRTLGTPVMSISAASLSFGDTYLGLASPPQQLTLTNSGKGTFFITDIFIAGQDYSYSSACGDAVAPGQSCKISVTFSPTGSGLRTASLVFYGDPPGTSYVNLSGTGIATSTAAISESVLAFGNQKIVTRSVVQAITITNSTAAALNTSAIAVTGIDSGDFVQVNNCGATLAPAVTCSVNVIFIPQLIGTRSASIAVPVNSAGTQQSIALSGTGVLSGFFEIVNSLTGKVLEVANGSNSDGTPIEQNALNGSQQQQWEFLPALNGSYSIANILTGKVLDVTGVSLASGTEIQQWDYLGGGNQQWQLVPVDDVHYEIVNQFSGKVLDVTNGSPSNGARIQQWDYVADAQQMWVLAPVLSYNIVNELSGDAVDVTGGSASDGTQIQQWPLAGSRQQRWQFIPVGDGYYAILNGLTGKVLDVTGFSTASGALIQQWDYLGGANQQWQLSPIDTIHWKIVNRFSGLALDDTNFSTTAGTAIQQWAYTGETNQQWQLAPLTYYSLVNRLSGAVLDLTNGATTNGTPIQQWAANGLQQQQWQLLPVGSGSCLHQGYCAIINNLSGKALEVTGSSTSDGAQVDQWDYQNNPNQQWVLEPVGDGFYAIVNLLSGKVLDVTGASISSGTLIQQWDYLGGLNQQWQLVPVSN